MACKLRNEYYAVFTGTDRGASIPRADYTHIRTYTLIRKVSPKRLEVS